MISISTVLLSLLAVLGGLIVGTITGRYQPLSHWFTTFRGHQVHLAICQCGMLCILFAFAENMSWLLPVGIGILVMTILGWSEKNPWLKSQKERKG